MANEEPWVVEPVSLAGLRLGIPQGLPILGLDQTVAARFSEAIALLSRAGARLTEDSIPLFDEMVRLNARGSITVMEAYAIHRDHLMTHGADYDPNIRARIEAGRTIPAADYIDIIRERARLVSAMDARLVDLDALICPTVPIVAPTIAEISGPYEAFMPKNLLALRNTTIVNFFDLCAISLPLPRQGGLPVGLMLVARNGGDRRLFRIAAAVEELLQA